MILGVINRCVNIKPTRRPRVYGGYRVGTGQPLVTESREGATACGQKPMIN